MEQQSVQVVLHANGKAIGVRIGDVTVTHNMVLRGPKLGRNFHPTEDVPAHLTNYLAAAKRLAEEMQIR